MKRTVLQRGAAAATFMALTAAGVIAICPLVRPASGQTQAEMNRQAAATYKKSDADLNAVYTQLRAALTKKQQVELRDSQRAWIKFRDADATFRSSAVEGGTLHSMIYLNALSDLTDARAQDLAQMMKRFHTEGEAF